MFASGKSGGFPRMTFIPDTIILGLCVQKSKM